MGGRPRRVFYGDKTRERGRLWGWTYNWKVWLAGSERVGLA